MAQLWTHSKLLRELTVIRCWLLLLQVVPLVEMAGGRGGAIAAKGGTRLMGPHVSDPNDDSGSLSVILVVILPVAQMFLFVALIILFRMCYRNYCLKPGAAKKRRSGGQLYLAKPRTNSSKSDASSSNRSSAKGEISIAMTSASSSNNNNNPPLMEILSPVLSKHRDSSAAPAPFHHMTSIVDVIEGKPRDSHHHHHKDSTSPGSSKDSTTTAPVPPLNGGIAYGVRGGGHANGGSSSSTISPTNLVPHTAIPITAPGNVMAGPFRPDHNYQVSTVCGGASGASSNIIHDSVITAAQLQPHFSQTHSLPITSLHQHSLPQMSVPYGGSHRAVLQRSNTLNDGIESLNSETICSDDEEIDAVLPNCPPEFGHQQQCTSKFDPDDEEEEMVVSGNSRNNHQSECIYHPRNSTSRPTSAASSSGLPREMRCMQTY